MKISKMMGWSVPLDQTGSEGPRALEDRLCPTWAVPSIPLHFHLRAPKELASVTSVGSSTGGRMGKPPAGISIVEAELEV